MIVHNSVRSNFSCVNKFASRSCTNDWIVTSVFRFKYVSIDQTAQYVLTSILVSISTVDFTQVFSLHRNQVSNYLYTSFFNAYSLSREESFTEFILTSCLQVVSKRQDHGVTVFRFVVRLSSDAIQRTRLTTNRRNNRATFSTLLHVINRTSSSSYSTNTGVDLSLAVFSINLVFRSELTQVLTYFICQTFGRRIDFFTIEFRYIT